MSRPSPAVVDITQTICAAPACSRHEPSDPRSAPSPEVLTIVLSYARGALTRVLLGEPAGPKRNPPAQNSYPATRLTLRGKGTLVTLPRSTTLRHAFGEEQDGAGSRVFG